MAIDLRTGDGQDLLHRLVRDVDVFVTNAPLDSRARLRVRYEDLAPLNARLVYGSITAYGETGEEASKPGFDSIALWARTGLMDLVRASADVPPARSLPGMGDHPTGTSLFAAIMAGLYHRERTGRGTMVATSLMANGLWMNAIPVQGILCGARTEVRPPREEAVSALANLYRCGDGRWFMLTITGDERHWESFARGIGREDLLTDPRFAATNDRRANARALTAILDAWFATKDWAAWSPILEKTGVAFGVVGHARRHSARRADAGKRRAGAHRRSACRRLAHRVEPAPDRRPGEGSADTRAGDRAAHRRGAARRRHCRGGDRATPAGRGDRSSLRTLPLRRRRTSQDLLDAPAEGEQPLVAVG